MRKRSIAVAGTALCLAILPSLTANAKKISDETARLFQKQIPKKDRIEHALNRLTFGPRPGDVQRVERLGLKKWIDLQLHPERIPENPVLAEKLKALDSLSMTSAQLVSNYPEPQMVKQMVKGVLPYPADRDHRMMIQKLADRIERRQKLGGQAPAEAKEMADLLTPEQIQALRTGTPQQRLAAFETIPSAQQDDILLVLPQGVRQSFFAAAPPVLRRKIELTAGPPQVVARDLTEGKVLRAIYGNRQLEEVLTDFWFNHFNVYLDKGADRFLVTAYERDAIRPHVLGKFRDLLEATAKSPAMLFYLDNWQSVGANGARQGNRRGLNENYGRELLELHTLGVDGGYTQHDVTEVARCFTGWTIERPDFGGDFRFNARMHDQGEKTVLGVKIKAGGGIEDGEKVLDLVARHPSTARFISRKLAQRFVADDPPASLVDRMAETFQKTDGNLRAVMETMLQSREFWSTGAYRAKMKSPLELMASAIRAADGDVDFAAPLVNQVAQMGEPLYRKQEPTGYSNSSRQWNNSAGLMARLNFAVNLADNKIEGVRVNGVAAASLGSPEFQRH